MTGVIIPKHRAVGVTPVVAKTSTGAVEHIPIARVTNLSQTLDKLKEAGFWVFGTDMDGTPSQDVYKRQVVGPLALVYIAFHRADYSMAALWFCIALLWAGLVFKQRHK